MKNTIDIFLVDNDQEFVHCLRKSILKLGSHKIKIHSFHCGEDCLAELEKEPDLIILDPHLTSESKSAMKSAEVLKRIKADMPDARVIMLSPQKKNEVVLNHDRSQVHIAKGDRPESKLDTYADQLIFNIIIENISKKNRHFAFLLIVLIHLGMLCMMVLSI